MWGRAGVVRRLFICIRSAVNAFNLNDALSNTSPGGTTQFGQDYLRLQRRQIDNNVGFNAQVDLRGNADYAWNGNLIANDFQADETLKQQFELEQLERRKR